MKMFKITYRIITFILLICLTFGIYNTTFTELKRGDLNTVLQVTHDDKEWIRKTFGHHKDFESLIYDGIIPFVTDNFVYDLDHNHCLPCQSFNFTLFRTKEYCNFHGVCFHFTCFTKIVVETLFPGIESIIVDVKINNDPDRAHSYNYFIYNGNTYMVDATIILNRFNLNMPYEDYAKNVGKISYQEYAENYYNDKIYRVY